MKKEETAPLGLLQMALSINKSNLEKIYWMEEFINYIEKKNIKLYKEARKYADDLEVNDYFTKEEKQKWGMTEEKSDCCGAEYVDETDLCSECLEHTGREN